MVLNIFNADLKEPQENHPIPELYQIYVLLKRSKETLEKSNEQLSLQVQETEEEIKTL
jgi:hypothetical protein